jgi:hypothetical protein
MPQALGQKKFCHQCFVGNKSLVFTLHVFWSKNFWPTDIWSTRFGRKPFGQRHSVDEIWSKTVWPADLCRTQYLAVTASTQSASLCLPVDQMLFGEKVFDQKSSVPDFRGPLIIVVLAVLDGSQPC